MTEINAVEQAEVSKRRLLQIRDLVARGPLPVILPGYPPLILMTRRVFRRVGPRQRAQVLSPVEERDLLPDLLEVLDAMILQMESAADDEDVDVNTRP